MIYDVDISTMFITNLPTLTKDTKWQKGYFDCMRVTLSSGCTSEQYSYQSCSLFVSASQKSHTYITSFI